MLSAKHIYTVCINLDPPTVLWTMNVYQMEPQSGGYVTMDMLGQTRRLNSHRKTHRCTFYVQIATPGFA